jgi:hypothetical protein
VLLPNRVSTLFALFKASLRSLVRLPFFFFPLIVHSPIYLAGKLAFYVINSEEAETFAQNKIVVGLLLLAFVIYPALFVFLWALFLLSPVGAVVAAGFVWLFAVYHIRSVENNYRAAKRLRACWKIVWGVWTGRAETRELLETRVRATRELVNWLAALERADGAEGDKARWLGTKGGPRLATIERLAEASALAATATDQSAAGVVEVDQVVQ